MQLSQFLNKIKRDVKKSQKNGFIGAWILDHAKTPSKFIWIGLLWSNMTIDVKNGHIIKVNDGTEL